MRPWEYSGCCAQWWWQGGGHTTLSSPGETRKASSPQKSYKPGWEVPCLFKNTRIKSDPIPEGFPSLHLLQDPTAAWGFWATGSYPCCQRRDFWRVLLCRALSWIWRIKPSSVFLPGCSDPQRLAPLPMLVPQAGYSDHPSPYLTQARCSPKLLTRDASGHMLAPRSLTVYNCTLSPPSYAVLIYLMQALLTLYCFPINPSRGTKPRAVRKAKDVASVWLSLANTLVTSSVKGGELTTAYFPRSPVCHSLLHPLLILYLSSSVVVVPLIVQDPS